MVHHLWRNIQLLARARAVTCSAADPSARPDAPAEASRRAARAAPANQLGDPRLGAGLCRRPGYSRFSPCSLRLRYAWEAAERSRAEKAARQQAEGQGLDPASDGLRDDISPRDGFDGIEPGGAANPAGEGEECNGMLPSARGEKGFSRGHGAQSWRRRRHGTQ